MGSIGTLPGERLAGLLADLCHKVQHGGITLDELALFTQRKNPFKFERNENGHVVLTFEGFNLTGTEEIMRLEVAGFRFSDNAKSCLMSKNDDSYDMNHCLHAGQVYKVAFMPTSEIVCDSDRTTRALRRRGIERYGYTQPRAGVVPRIREHVTDEEMMKMGFWYIAAPHYPIMDYDGNPDVLCASRGGDGQSIGVSWDYPTTRWDDRGALAFVVPQDQS